jgi:hypothetical protein
MFDFKSISSLIDRLQQSIPQIERATPVILSRIDSLEAELRELARENIRLLTLIEQNTRHQNSLIYDHEPLAKMEVM